MPTFLAILAGALTVAGNVSAKQWALRGAPWIFWVMMAFYTASSVSYAYSLRAGTFTVMTAVTTTFILLVSSAVGLLYFKDQLTLARGLGLVCAFAAIVLLAYPQRA